MDVREQEKIRQAVRKRYGQLVEPGLETVQGQKPVSGCCASSPASESGPVRGCGCGSSQPPELSSEEFQQLLGYSLQDLASAPEGANMGLGCGNPVALASLDPGETVVDLGSGGGFDCLLAAKRVGPQGRVIGVDMTPEMVSKARLNADKVKAANAEFRLGEIEHLPVADNSADIIMSNCVINLSADKSQVYQEAFRVLKPNGRVAISDILTLKPLPAAIQKDLALVSACIGGAATIEDTRRMLEDTGFADIRIDAHPISAEVIDAFASDNEAGSYVVSANIMARKP